MPQNKVVILLLLTFLLTSGQGVEVDPGEPLYLTPLIRQGLHAQAQEAAVVSDLAPILSYSGFITVNEEYNSNLFFWFFPAEPSYNLTNGDSYHDEEIPVILWNDGGPGASLFFSIFNQNGPYWRNVDGFNFTLNPHSWHKKYHMIYIDNPVTVGFSYTGSDQGFITSEDEAAVDLYEFLQQFFFMFPHLQRNPFYNAGVSYGAKYAVQTANHIHHRNLLDDEPTKYINLTGVIVDSPWIDPYTQLYYADFIYNAGLISEVAKDELVQKEEEARRMIVEGEFLQAAEISAGIQETIVNLTGFNPLYQIYDEQWDLVDMTPWITSPLTRKSLHVGNLPFSIHNTEQLLRMSGSIMRSSKPKLEELLQAGYRFLLSVGNMDGTTGHLGVMRMLKALNWEGVQKLVNGPRRIWHLKGLTGVAGYQSHSGNATLAIVRNAGHSTSVDKPEEMLDLVRTFLRREIAEQDQLRK